MTDSMAEKNKETASSALCSCSAPSSLGVRHGNVRRSPKASNSSDTRCTGSGRSLRLPSHGPLLLAAQRIELRAHGILPLLPARYLGHQRVDAVLQVANLSGTSRCIFSALLIDRVSVSVSALCAQCAAV